MKYTAKDLTIEQKLRLLMGVSGWYTYTADDKLYQVSVSDGPVGLRKPAQDEKGEWYDLPAVAHPSCQLLAQTWRPELAHKCGEMIADDCIDNDIDILLAPGVNIKRNPLCGRNFEYFSEDPLVSGIFGREFIDGVQSREVGATLKHFCCNNAEYSRYHMSSEVDERTLREIYLEPFRLASEAKPWATMCAYNLVNGVRMSEHKKLYTVLREEFGMDGLIMSDWGAVQDHVASIKAGLDLEMPEFSPSQEKLTEAYKNGEITEEEIDACVNRMLYFIERCEAASKTRKSQSTVEERRAASREVAARGIVLLKNEFGLLPFEGTEHISITGDYANSYISGGGSSHVTTFEPPVGLADALKAAMPDATIAYQPMRTRGAYPTGPLTFRAINGAYGKDAAIVCVGQVDKEGADREDMFLSAEHVKLIKDTAKKTPNTIVIIFAGAPIDMTDWIDDVAAVVWAGYPGEMGALALADILCGKLCPTGRLTETFPMTIEDAPTYGQFFDAQRCVYSEGLLVGYRWYDSAADFGRAPEYLFPFGYGLSYGEVNFDFTKFACTPTEDGGFDVHVTLTNDGDCDSAELVQVYVREVNPMVYRPYKELRAFRMVDVAEGKSEDITLHLTHRDFAHYSTARDAWTVTPGIYEVIVARDAEQIEYTFTVEVK